ncbi:putative Spore coat protein U domain-containing protein [Hyphomicrobium sp. 1Nfss2.1]
MKRGVIGAIIALTVSMIVQGEAHAAEASGKVQITATVDTICTLIPAAPTTYMDVADFSDPGKSSIKLSPYINNGLAVIDCNAPATVTLESENGAVTTTGAATPLAKNYFDYDASLTIADGAGFSCLFSSTNNALIGGEEFKECEALLLPALSDVALTITPVDPGFLVPGTYNDVLTVTIVTN